MLYRSDDFRADKRVKLLNKIIDETEAQTPRCDIQDRVAAPESVLRKGLFMRLAAVPENPDDTDGTDPDIIDFDPASVRPSWKKIESKLENIQIDEIDFDFAALLEYKTYQKAKVRPVNTPIGEIHVDAAQHDSFIFA